MLFQLWTKALLIVGKKKSRVKFGLTDSFSHINFIYACSASILTFRPKTNVRTPFDITDGKFFNLKYQTDAIQLALKSIETHNGTIVADVVGLGKSIIASTIAHNLRLRTIVISPPHLKSGWDAYKDEFSFTGTVFSSGKISEALTH